MGNAVEEGERTSAIGKNSRIIIARGSVLCGWAFRVSVNVRLISVEAQASNIYYP